MILHPEIASFYILRQQFVTFPIHQTLFLFTGLLFDKGLSTTVQLYFFLFLDLDIGGGGGSTDCARGTFDGGTGASAVFFDGDV